MPKKLFCLKGFGLASKIAIIMAFCDKRTKPLRQKYFLGTLAPYKVLIIKFATKVRKAISPLLDIVA